MKTKVYNKKLILKFDDTFHQIWRMSFLFLSLIYDNMVRQKTDFTFCPNPFQWKQF